MSIKLTTLLLIAAALLLASAILSDEIIVWLLSIQSDVLFIDMPQ